MNNINLDKKRLLESFLHYISYDTQAKNGAKKSPTSVGQARLAKHIYQELSALGLKNIELNKFSVLTAFLPSNVNPKTPTIGFIMHLDTPTECNCKNTYPEVIPEYRGGDISLGVGDEYISPVYYPFLQRLIGKTLIVGDGKNLIGVENKASIAEVINALTYLVQNNIPHCNIQIAIIPDKEIGLGLNLLPIDKLSCDWAYSFNGGEIGNVYDESFYSAEALITLYGSHIHTDIAKGRMQNALALACEFQQGFPKDEVPEKTENKEGFFHLVNFEGDVEQVKLNYLICDFDLVSFEQRKAFLAMMVVDFNRHKKLFRRAEIELVDRYVNIAEQTCDFSQSIHLANKAIKSCNIEPKNKPIRSNALGSMLSQKNIVCPSLATGGYNFHSKHEVITLEDMESATKIIIEIARQAVDMLKK
ncbi:peptidase T [Bisgaardia hudsonensis]|uniref:Peptidase T n=1 Tax=Bisgaardia hudsonensis TaxID=109472 RepID=A0A4V2SJB9_9PAST|nr:peptidase T [Bisgaardia hudsonensis]QLB12608.1 peptidase T [Bisgaardia hudsonensis]TCP14150.1 peptidase T [Bisgaardia hudsonensis]